MKPLCQHVQIEGLGAERQLVHLQRQGYTLYDIRRMDLRRMEFGFARKDSEKILTFLQERGFVCHPLPARGHARKLQVFKSQTPLLCFILCAVLALSVGMRFLWRVEIWGAGAYIGEVRTYLAENNLHVGRMLDSIDTKAIANDLTYRLPRVAWVRAAIDGLTLRIDVTQGVPAPPIESEGENGSIIARCDGVIDSIAVYAGTAAVKPGDSVKTGDILIYGHERGKDDALVSVRARGTVIAHTYISETATVSAKAYQTHRTGRQTEAVYAHLSFLQLPLTETPNYLISEYESQFLPVGGAWLPLQIEKRTVFETYLEEDFVDEEALKAEAARLCLQNLLLKRAKNDEIIDKWLYYSMIEGGILSATVKAEVRTEIGLFSPETPE